MRVWNARPVSPGALKHKLDNHVYGSGASGDQGAASMMVWNLPGSR
jgi:hypothetical protein